MKTLTIRDWYVATYPEDELGYEIDPKVNFLTLKNVLNEGKDVYEHLGVGDSLVRERVFEKASRIYGWSYDRIYRLWLDGATGRRKEYLRGVYGVVA